MSNENCLKDWAAERQGAKMGRFVVAGKRSSDSQHYRYTGDAGYLQDMPQPGIFAFIQSEFIIGIGRASRSFTNRMP